MNQTDTYETPLSWLAESILATASISLTPMEMIWLALSDHIDSVATKGESCWHDRQGKPVDHGQFLEAIAEVTQFFAGRDIFLV